MLKYYSWQSLERQEYGKIQWLSSINGFDSLEEALELCLDSYSMCKLHEQHRIVCNYFDEETKKFLGQSPVFYLIEVKDATV